MKEKNVDLYASILMLVIAGIFWSQMGSFTKFGAIFPRAIIVLLAISSIGLFVKSLLSPEKKTIFEHKEKLDAVVFLVTIILWVVLMKIIGFVVISIIAYFVITTYLDTERKNRTIKNHLVTLGFICIQVFAFYLVFSILLHVPVPHGFLF